MAGTVCTETQWQCETQDKCIAIEFLCDTVDDCGDGMVRIKRPVVSKCATTASGVPSAMMILVSMMLLYDRLNSYFVPLTDNGIFIIGGL